MWGTRAFVLLYDPDYIKLVLGRSGEKETLSRRQTSFEYMPLGFKFHKTLAYQMPMPEFLQTPSHHKPDKDNIIYS